MKTKYSKGVILLHAVQGFLILFILITGTFILSEMPNAIEKLDTFKMHIILGLLITLLTLIRIFIVKRSKKPQPLNVGIIRAKIIKFNHVFIYVVLLLVSISGIVLAKSTGIGQMAIFGVSVEFYNNFKDFPIGVVHGILTKVLMFLILMHLTGIVFYKLKTKENVLSRMWFFKEKN